MKYLFYWIIAIAMGYLIGAIVEGPDSLHWENGAKAGFIIWSTSTGIVIMFTGYLEDWQ